MNLGSYGINGIAYVKNYWCGSQVGTWTSTGGYVDGTNSGGNALTTLFSSGAMFSNIAAASNNIAGFTFSPTPGSIYLISANTTLGAAGIGGVTGVRLTDGTTIISLTGVQIAGSGTWLSPATVSGFYKTTYAGPITIKLQVGNLAGPSSNIESPDASIPAIQWTVLQIA